MGYVIFIFLVLSFLVVIACYMAAKSRIDKGEKKPYKEPPKKRQAKNNVVKPVSKAKVEKGGDATMGFASDMKAMADFQRIKNGGTIKLSVGQITTMIVNMPQARRNLSELEFTLVYSLYKQLRKYKTKKELDFNEYLNAAAKIVLEFNKIAPYEKYSGYSRGEIGLFVEELSSLWHLINDEKPIADFAGVPKTTKRVPLSAFIVMVLVLSGVVAYMLHSAEEMRNTVYDQAYAEAYDAGHKAGERTGYTSGYNQRYLDVRDKLIERVNLSNELDAIRGEYEFFHEYAVIVTTAAGIRYHHYGCPRIEGRNFYIYNIDLAKSYGYTPCSDCWG